MLSHGLLVFFRHLIEFIAYAADADDIVGIVVLALQFFAQGADVDHDGLGIVFHAVCLPDGLEDLGRREDLARMLDQQLSLIHISEPTRPY